MGAYFNLKRVVKLKIANLLDKGTRKRLNNLGKRKDKILLGQNRQTYKRGKGGAARRK